MYQASQSYAVNNDIQLLFWNMETQIEQKMCTRQDKSSVKVPVFTKQKGIAVWVWTNLKNSCLRVLLLPWMQSGSLLFSIVPVPFPNHHVNWEWDAHYITNLSPSQPAQLTKPVMCPIQWVGAKSRLLREGGVFHGLHRMLLTWLSATYKHISGLHGYHTPTMFGAYTILAELPEAAVWLCRVKLHKKVSFVCKCIYYSAADSSKWSVGKSNATMFISMTMVPAVPWDEAQHTVRVVLHSHSLLPRWPHVALPWWLSEASRPLPLYSQLPLPINFLGCQKLDTQKEEYTQLIVQEWDNMTVSV